MLNNRLNRLGNQLAIVTTFQVVEDGNAMPKTLQELSIGDTILDGHGNDATISSISYDEAVKDAYAIFTADGQVSVVLSDQIIDTISNKIGRLIPTTPAQMIKEGIKTTNGEYRFRFPYIESTDDEREAILQIIAAECREFDISISDDGYPIYRSCGFDDFRKLSYIYDLAHTAGIATSRIVRDDEIAVSGYTDDFPTSYLEILTKDRRLIPDNCVYSVRIAARVDEEPTDSVTDMDSKCFDVLSSAIIDAIPCGAMESARIKTIGGDGRAVTAEGFLTVL